jgi:methylmalonyl-CoA mutase N-terminal domain/subunit
MADAIAYVEEVARTGLPVDAFAPRLAFYFIAQADFFEEIAKFRAARRIWAKIMRDRFGAARPESMRLRFHCQTAAATLTKAQPLNNVVRTALQALAAVLGGAQSLHTNGLDEAYAIPSEEAMKIALRTQQIIAEETGVTSVIDPLGGSYYVEALTNRIEAEVFAILRKVDEMGGTVRAIEQAYFQREIADSAYDFARRKASGERVVIGVNRYVEPDETTKLEIHKVDPDVEARQVARLREVRRQRDGARVQALLDRLADAARDPSVNLMPVTIDLVKARATMGEIVTRLRDVFGTYVEKPVF